MRENLRRLDREIASCQNDTYLFSHCLRSRAELMQRMGASEDEIIAFWEQYRCHSAARSALFAIYERTDPAAAIRLLLECRESDASSRYDLIRHTQELIKLHQKTNQKQPYEQELRRLILEYGCLDIPYVSQLKAVTSQQDWPPMLDHLFKLVRTRNERLSLLHFEGMYQQLLEQITQSHRLD